MQDELRAVEQANSRLSAELSNVRKIDPNQASSELALAISENDELRKEIDTLTSQLVTVRNDCDELRVGSEESINQVRTLEHNMRAMRAAATPGGGSCTQCAELAEQLNILSKLNVEMGEIQKRNEQHIADLEWTTVRNRKSSPGGPPLLDTLRSSSKRELICLPKRQG